MSRRKRISGLLFASIVSPEVMDYIRRGKLDVTQLKFLVLDEADDLQKKDDRNDIPRLNAQIKRGRRDRVQTLFFSATLHTPEVPAESTGTPSVRNFAISSCDL